MKKGKWLDVICDNCDSEITKQIPRPPEGDGFFNCPSCDYPLDVDDVVEVKK